MRNGSSATMVGAPGAIAVAPERGQPLVRGVVMSDRTCSVAGCEDAHVARGFCNRHYLKMRKYGSPLAGTERGRFASIEERFLSHVNRGLGSCWLWTGSRSSDGYGSFRVGASMVGAHRWAYEAWESAIPPGLQLDHLCRVRHCVNPAHLEPVTQQENCRRGIVPLVAGRVNRAKERCPNGHVYDETNTYWWRGWRRCRACNSESQRRRRGT